MKYLCVLFLALTVSACSLYDIKSADIPTQYYPAKTSTEEVQYLESANRAHEVIGNAIVNAERNQKWNYVLEKLKYEAAMIGGDAITNITTNAGDGKWARIKPQKLFGNSHIRANFVADVIVFK